MAHASTQADDFSPDDALHRIQSERSSRSWIALILFVVSAAAVAGSFYLAFQGLPATPGPALNAPGPADP